MRVHVIQHGNKKCGMYECSPELLRVGADKETGKADNRKERIGEEAKWARNKEFPRISYIVLAKSQPRADSPGISVLTS